MSFHTNISTVPADQFEQRQPAGKIYDSFFHSDRVAQHVTFPTNKFSLRLPWLDSSRRNPARCIFRNATNCRFASFSRFRSLPWSDSKQELSFRHCLFRLSGRLNQGCYFFAKTDRDCAAICNLLFFRNLRFENFLILRFARKLRFFCNLLIFTNRDMRAICNFFEICDLWLLAFCDLHAIAQNRKMFANRKKQKVTNRKMRKNARWNNRLRLRCDCEFS